MMKAQAFLDSQPRGTRSRIAEAAGLAYSTVTEWVMIPPKHAQIVSALTGEPLHILRPDIFPSPAVSHSVENTPGLVSIEPTGSGDLIQASSK